MDFRIGHGYDVHALADGLPLVLGGRGAGRHRAALSRHVGRFCGHRLEDPAAPRGGTAARKGLRDRERGLHDPRPAAQVAAAHRRHAPCDGRRNGRRRRPGVGQGHDHGASGLRGARGRHLRLRRGAYLPSCGQEIIQNLQFRIQNCLYLYDQTPNRDAYEAVENNLSTPCLRAHDI